MIMDYTNKQLNNTNLEHQAMQDYLVEEISILQI